MPTSNPCDVSRKEHVANQALAAIIYISPRISPRRHHGSSRSSVPGISFSDHQARLDKTPRDQKRDLAAACRRLTSTSRSLLRHRPRGSRWHRQGLIARRICSLSPSNMGTPFPATYAQSYFDHIQIANMEGHPPGEPTHIPLDIYLVNTCGKVSSNPQEKTNM